jgi:PhnB protein
MQVQPYLFFEGRCEEAIEFYRKALGAEVQMLMRYKDNPEPTQEGCGPPGSAEKVMHSCFKIGDSEIMASDGMCSGKPSFQGFSLSVPAKDTADAERKFNALAAGGTVKMPLGKTFYSPSFGMVQDKFGMGWMVIVPQ